MRKRSEEEKVTRLRMRKRREEERVARLRMRKRRSSCNTTTYQDKHNGQKIKKGICLITQTPWRWNN